MMKKFYLLLLILLILFSFFLQLLGLMELLPLYLTSPILFVSLLLLVNFLNNRNRFKGF
jgi:amino acid transporter